MSGMKRNEYTSDWIKGLLYLSHFPRFIQEPPPSHLNAHRFSMVFSLPDVCESIRSIVRGFIGHSKTGEYSRSTEEGVGQKSGPRA